MLKMKTFLAPYQLYFYLDSLNCAKLASVDSFYLLHLKEKSGVGMTEDETQDNTAMNGASYFTIFALYL